MSSHQLTDFIIFFIVGNTPGLITGLIFNVQSASLYE